MKNYQSWLQGYYNHMAIISALSKEVKYLEQPLKLNTNPKTKREQKLEIAQKIKENLQKGRAILQQRSEK